MRTAATLTTRVGPPALGTGIAGERRSSLLLSLPCLRLGRDCYRPAGRSFYSAPWWTGAEGSGVYFSEGAPRYTAAEGSHERPSAVIVIDRPQSPTGWWRSKNAVCQKYGRPRTWHTAGKSLALIVTRRDDTGNVPFIFCIPRLGEKGKNHGKVFCNEENRGIASGVSPSRGIRRWMADVS